MAVDMEWTRIGVVRGVSIIALMTLAACGGGGGGGGAIGGVAPGSGSGSTGGGSTWQPNVFQPYSTFENQCANPRTGTDSSGRPFPDVKGSVTSENNWLRSWTNDLYLWYDEVDDRNPSNYNDTETFFDLMRTTQKTASGQDKDKFHFTYPTAEWEALSQAGVSAGYGAMFSVVSGTPPRKILVAVIEAGSPAANAGLLRGDEILMVDGVDVVNGSNVAVLNAGLFPSASDQNHTFQVKSGASSRSVTLRSANVTSAPVHTVKTLPTTHGNVGYILFNDHNSPSEAALVNAVTTLKNDNIVDLVLDLRYNGGGWLEIASELSYMIAGSARTSGQTFEKTSFNSKHPTTDPVTGEPLEPTPFFSQSRGFSVTKGTALPTLDLRRVFVLTSDSTCSASEAIINGLRGVDVQVIQIGTTTCGKPYGFYPFDNCGTTYFSIQMKGVNAKGFGDYTDGFSPQNTSGLRGTLVEGCSVADDYTHQLGAPLDGMLSVALNYMQSNSCGVPPAAITHQKLRNIADVPADQILHRPQWREIRLLSREH